MDRYNPHQVAQPPCTISRRGALRLAASATTVALATGAAPHVATVAGGEPLTEGSDLQPRPAIAAILQAIDRFPLVGIAALDPPAGAV